MVILYFVRWFNIILVLRFLFQPGRLCTKLGFFVYYYLSYYYLHQSQENENVRTIKEGKIILKIALRLWSYVLDFLFSNPIVWSYIFRRIYYTIKNIYKYYLILLETTHSFPFEHFYDQLFLSSHSPYHSPYHSQKLHLTIASSCFLIKEWHPLQVRMIKQMS